MKAFTLALVATLLGLGITGCQSPRTTRIQEKSALYSKFDAPTQKRIAEGIVAIGDSDDVVYIALGKPTSIQTHNTPAGQIETWTYKNFVLSSEMAVQLSNNNPGSRYQGIIESPGNPRHGPSTAGTGRYGPELSLANVAGAATATLQIDLQNGAVSALRLPDSK
ncbi:MAG: hypothetical protein KBA71_04420 [Opitutaceae bacterium]|nr:hypothetical protein [Opitutaceae bacterium]